MRLEHKIINGIFNYVPWSVLCKIHLSLTWLRFKVQLQQTSTAASTVMHCYGVWVLIYCCSALLQSTIVCFWYCISNVQCHLLQFHLCLTVLEFVCACVHLIGCTIALWQVFLSSFCCPESGFIYESESACKCGFADLRHSLHQQQAASHAPHVKEETMNRRWYEKCTRYLASCTAC